MPLALHIACIKIRIEIMVNDCVRAPIVLQFLIVWIPIAHLYCVPPSTIHHHMQYKLIESPPMCHKQLRKIEMKLFMGQLNYKRWFAKHVRIIKQFIGNNESQLVCQPNERRDQKIRRRKINKHAKNDVREWFMSIIEIFLN